jgi:hypothetical protein
MKKFLKRAFLPLAAAAALLVPAGMATATVNGATDLNCASPAAANEALHYCGAWLETGDQNPQGEIGNWLFVNLRGTHSYSFYTFSLYYYTESGTFLGSKHIDTARTGTAYGANMSVPAAADLIYLYANNFANQADNYKIKLIWCVTGTSC